MSNNDRTDSGWTTVGNKPKTKRTNNNNDKKTYTGLNYQTQNNATMIRGGCSNKRVMPGEGNQFTKHNAGRNQQNKRYQDATKIEQDAEEGNLKINTINHNLRMEIQQARQRKKWTQKEFAQLCSLPLSVIRSYEKGTAPPNQNQLRAMSKVLGITLSNKK